MQAAGATANLNIMVLLYILCIWAICLRIFPIRENMDDLATLNNALCGAVVC